MPINIVANSSQSVSIPEDAANVNIKLFGGSGGGEFVDQYTLVSTAGTSGGITSFIGLNANGGQGGGIGGKNQGGNGGSANQTVNWSSLGASVSTVNGSSGQLSAGGTGGTIPGYSSINGGNGTPLQVSYTSNVYHVFNDDTDTHIVTQSSPDIIVGFESQYAPGAPCNTSLAYKHYSVNFVAPYDDANYSINIFSVCQQAAAGGTAGPFYVYGIDYKTRFGFRIWFCRAGNNSYVRCFSFTTTGNRTPLVGRGGGGSGFIEANISRAQLIESSIYRPGTSHQLTIGGAGSRGGTTAENGSSGRAFLTIVLEPRISVSLDDTTIIRGECTTLRWSVTGDVSQVSISPGIGTVNISGTRQVCPTETVTYIVTATGMGGTDVKQVTLTVYQPPTVNLSGPESLNYGQQGTLVYESTDVDVSFVLEPTYTYRNGSTGGAMFNTNLPLGAISNGTITTNIPYNDYGPTSVTYTLTGTGNGGQETKQITVPIIIDETPENFLVPETDDAFKSQEPIYSPNSDVTSYEIIVDGVDIPVEIKADKPILVEINNDDTWDQIRSI
jgi:hypothetical protein